MNQKITVAAIIPARMNSTRYPGKPLLDFYGLPMIEHVRRRAILCDQFSEVIVATCDQDIVDAVLDYGGNVVMTSAEHSTASDRVAEAVKQIDCSHVINVQGDELLVLPQDLRQMINAININPAGSYWNAVARIEDAEELSDTGIVKCAVSESKKIMYCARDFTHLITQPGLESVQKILGITGHSQKGIHTYTRLRRTPIEITQSIDQLRIVEHDLVLQGVGFSAGYPGINNKNEEVIVRKILEEDPIQKQVLTQLLKNG